MALDGSAGMLEVAKQSGLYKELYTVILGQNALPESLKGRFRAVASVGTLGRNRAPPESFDEMLACLKGDPGDALIFTIREDCYKECGFKERLESLQDDGTLKLVHQESYERGLHNEWFENNELYEKPIPGILFHLELKEPA